MIKISSNIGQVAASLNAKIKLVQDKQFVKDKLLRTMAISILPVMAQRIHIEGKKADGSQMGTYSNAYLRLRASKKYNRGNSPKVILSLTTKMENDFSIIPNSTPTGYGLGFKDPVNTQKSKWMEERYGQVYGLTDGEKETVQSIADQFIKDIFATP